MDATTAEPTSNSVTSLHNRVHGVVTAAQRTDGSWLSHLETALGALALAAHPVKSSPEADRAVARIQRWLADGEFGRGSEDVAALALGARAERAVQRRTHELQEEAITRVQELVSRTDRIVPTLHLTLCAWGLAEVVSDRNNVPWPQMRERFHSAPREGIDDALAALGQGISLGSFDASLLRRVIGAASRDTSLADLSVLVWLEDRALTEAARTLPVSDSGIAFLTYALSGGIDRLDAETTEATFVAPLGHDYDPAATFVESEALSLFEALLLDLVLGPRSARGTILAPEQLQAFVRREKRGFIVRVGRLAAGGVAAVAVVGAAISATTLRQVAHEPWQRWISVSLAILAIGWTLSLFVLRQLPSSRVSRAAIANGLVATVLFAFVAFDRFRTHPFVKDVDLIIGIAFGTMIPLLVETFKERPRDP